MLSRSVYLDIRSPTCDSDTGLNSWVNENNGLTSVTYLHVYTMVCDNDSEIDSVD